MLSLRGDEVCRVRRILTPTALTGIFVQAIVLRLVGAFRDHCLRIEQYGDVVLEIPYVESFLFFGQSICVFLG